MIIIGIDPGVSGGIAAIYTSLESYPVWPMPETERDILTCIQNATEGNGFAFIEGVNTGYPGSSKTAVAKLYGNYMACRMAVIAAGIRLEIVKPHEWQKALGIPKRTKTETGTKWKNRLKAKAQQLFPDVKVTLKTADALLIAEYGRRQMMGES